MRILNACLMITLLAVLGCGGTNDQKADDAETGTGRAEMPSDDVHSAAMGQTKGDAVHQGSGINADVNLDPEIADDWRAVKVKVVNLETMDVDVHEIAIGDEAPLGDSGLTVRVVSFIPDFVMGEQGITSRSAEPQNPAARVVIMEEGKDDFEGWLFGAMPEIHPFPHDVYGVVLVEGVPAE